MIEEIYIIERPCIDSLVDRRCASKRNCCERRDVESSSPLPLARGNGYVSSGSLPGLLANPLSHNMRAKRIF